MKQNFIIRRKKEITLLVVLFYLGVMTYIGFMWGTVTLCEQMNGIYLKDGQCEHVELKNYSNWYSGNPLAPELPTLNLSLGGSP